LEWLVFGVASHAASRCLAEEMAVTDLIVVGIDGSDASIAALNWAVDEASRRGFAVRAVTVHLPQGHIVIRDGARRGVAVVTTRSIHEDRVNRLADIVGKVDTDVVIDQVVAVGPAEEVLVDMSRDAALLVLGSHGASRVLTGLTLGAVAAHCIRHAACPVVVIP
jgi:nucleotide-binding universal stress UspA family protein